MVGVIRHAMYVLAWHHGAQHGPARHEPIKLANTGPAAHETSRPHSQSANWHHLTGGPTQAVSLLVQDCHSHFGALCHCLLAGELVKLEPLNLCLH